MPKLHESITPDSIADPTDRAGTTLDSPGLYIACGADTEDVEPDAAPSICECCGRPAVYGVERIAIMAFRPHADPLTTNAAPPAGVRRF
jgi:hypothetical protein